MQLGNKAFRIFCIVMDGWARGEWQFVFLVPVTTLIPVNDFMGHMLHMSLKKINK